MNRKSIVWMFLLFLLVGCSMTHQKMEKQLTEEEREIEAYRILGEHALDEPAMLELWNGRYER